MYQPGFQVAGSTAAGAPPARVGAASGLLPVAAPVLRRAAGRVRAGLAAERRRLADDVAAARHGLIAGSIDLDLGSGLFSRRWWMKAAALAALVAGALWAGAQVQPILPGSRRPFTPAEQEGGRAHAIAPLAQGARTGAPPLVNARLLRPLAEPPERPRVERSVALGRAGLAAALRNAGVGRDDLAEVTAMLGAVRPEPGVRAELVLGRRPDRTVPRPLERLTLRAAFDLQVEITRVDGALRLRRMPIRIDSTPLRVAGSVGGNLGRALRSAGIPAAQAGEFVRQMRHVIDFERGLARNDRFDIVIEQDRAATGETRHGRLLFGAVRRAGKPAVEIGLHQGDYYLANGEGVKRGLMMTPVQGARLTSGFGMRLHPLLGFSRMHQGVDFSAGAGEPIMAAGGGTVSFAGWHGGHGKYVMIRHNKDLASAYGHMQRIDVKPGQRVRQGQNIGTVGSTGLSTGPHLHYEVWLRGKPVNPVALRYVGGAELSGAALAEFRSRMQRWRGLAVMNGAEPAAKTPRPSR